MRNCNFIPQAVLKALAHCKHRLQVEGWTDAVRWSAVGPLR